MDYRPTYTTVYYPQGDRITERGIQTVCQKMRCTIFQHGWPYKKAMEETTRAINDTISKITLKRRIDVFNNKNLNPEGDELILQRIDSYHKALQDKHNMNIKTPLNFLIGDKILINNRGYFREKQHKIAPKYVGPYEVVRELNQNAYLVATPTTKVILINTKHMKAYNQS
jgi:hypothetical protein